MAKYSAVYDTYLKAYGCILLYALSAYELIIQYIWLLRYRLGLVSGPDESLYLSGRSLLITGGLGTIASEVAKTALRHGNHVTILDVIPQAKAQEILGSFGYPDKVRYYEVDLCKLEDVKAVCRELIDSESVPDIFLFNAAIMHSPYRLSNRMESQLLVSYLSHCVILSELRPALSPRTRLVFVSSVCHKAGFIQLDDLHGRRGYSAHLWYGQAKICQLLLSAYLTAKTELQINSVHPGIVKTTLYKDVFLRHLFGLFDIMTPAEAALCPTYACLSSEAKDLRGQYLEFCRPVAPNALVGNCEVQAELFQQTVDILKPYTDFAKIVHSQ